MNKNHLESITESPGVLIPLTIGAVVVAAAAATVVSLVAPDEVVWEEDTLEIFGLPVVGKRGLLVRWNWS